MKHKSFVYGLLFIAIFVHQNKSLGQTVLSFSVNQPPTPLTIDAGSNLQIVVGSTVQLGGAPTASGGFGNYQYAWDNAEYLNDASIANPTASGLTAPTTFTLTVTDSAGLCVKQAQVLVLVDIITGISGIPNGSKLVLFNPNPFFDFVQIEASSGLFKVSLHSATGQLLFVGDNLNSAKQIRIETAQLPEGIYIVSAELNDGTIQYKKLCKTATN
jgi:hypothetical protein